MAGLSRPSLSAEGHMRTSFELAKLYNHVKRCQNGNTNTVRAHGAALPCTVKLLFHAQLL